MGRSRGGGVCSEVPAKERKVAVTEQLDEDREEDGVGVYPSERKLSVTCSCLSRRPPDSTPNC